MQYPEENHYPKALAYSTGVMILLLLLSYWIIIGAPFQPNTGTGGLVVNYGTSIEGMGTDYMSVEEPSIDPNANNTSPDKVVPNTDPVKTPSAVNDDEKVVTQDNEDAPSVITKDKKSDNPTTAPETKETKPTVNPNALYKGKTKNPSTGKGDGEGAGPGNQGSVNGDPLAANYGAGGSGFGDLALANRQFVSRPKMDDDGQVSGKIVVEIRVDKNGEVVFARAGARGTTIADAKLWRKCELAVKGARLNQVASAPDVQVGTIVFSFKVD